MTLLLVCAVHHIVILCAFGNRCVAPMAVLGVCRILPVAVCIAVLLRTACPVYLGCCVHCWHAFIDGSTVFINWCASVFRLRNYTFGELFMKGRLLLANLSVHFLCI